MSYFCLLIRDIIKPVLVFINEVFKVILAVIKLILMLPTLSLIKLLTLLKDGALGLLTFLKSVLEGVRMIKNVIIPAAKTSIEHRETTFNLI